MTNQTVWAISSKDGHIEPCSVCYSTGAIAWNLCWSHSATFFGTVLSELDFIKEQKSLGYTAKQFKLVEISEGTNT